MTVSDAERAFIENFQWLKADSEQHDLVLRGAASEMADHMIKSGLDSPRDVIKAFTRETGEISASAQLRFFAELCRALADTDDASSNDIHKSCRGAAAVYVRSAASDCAFDMFSKALGELRAIYVASFRESCEAVYHERAEYCILPLEDASDGLLLPFRRMLLKYDLAVCGAAVCAGVSEAGSVFSLVGTSSGILGGDVYEIYIPSLTHRDSLRLCELCVYLDTEMLRITSVAAEYGISNEYHICVRAPGTSARALKFALSALYPSYQLLGRYFAF